MWPRFRHFSTTVGNNSRRLGGLGLVKRNMVVGGGKEANICADCWLISMSALTLSARPCRTSYCCTYPPSCALALPIIPSPSCRQHADDASGSMAHSHSWLSQRVCSRGGVRAAGLVRQVGRVVGGGYVRQWRRSVRTVDSAVPA